MMPNRGLIVCEDLQPPATRASPASCPVGPHCPTVHPPHPTSSPTSELHQVVRGTLWQANIQHSLRIPPLMQWVQSLLTVHSQIQCQAIQTSVYAPLQATFPQRTRNTASLAPSPGSGVKSPTLRNREPQTASRDRAIHFLNLDCFFHTSFGHLRRLV